MPWKEWKPMDDRLKHVARQLDGEKMSSVCREFGISKPTGYEIVDVHRILTRFFPMNIQRRKVSGLAGISASVAGEVGQHEMQRPGWSGSNFSAIQQVGPDESRVEPAPNPFVPKKALTMSPVAGAPV